MREQVSAWITEQKIVAIARGVRPEQMADTAEALYRGGIRSLEITFNQASDTGIVDTAESIRLAKKLLGDRMRIGAGTVMTIAQAEAAQEAGADFALAPNTDPKVIRRIVELGMAAVPGAFTPSEIATAYEAGADIVKLFPAGNLGIDYVKAIRGPINHIPLMAVGGVNLDNTLDFLNNGFTSVGIGSNIVSLPLIQAEKWEELEALAAKYAELVK